MIKQGRKWCIVLVLAAGYARRRKKLCKIEGVTLYMKVCKNSRVRLYKLQTLTLNAVFDKMSKPA